ncbi:type IV pilin protein [Halanaerobium hydrogeniformans]|uniref:Tfp pilus assembly protein, major pilin PilA n=1 Tax=Halanaerobium hydrogeniformans TaxID=656519 RepID=E4RLC9_HALHG|nr:prepilin-type N-terminal cleavage/methylation domain-containing protein [Halanaerobium hydrogeniformans]ADQ14843.1 Tfp pilus assembly protein, major pilin PilA [Halanaerobium hydrogeniformans]
MSKLLNNIFKEKDGFTLIELLIVISIIGILMSIAVPTFSGVKDRANITVIKSDLHNIMHGLEMYYMDHHSYPGTNDGSDISDVLDSSSLNLNNDAGDYSYLADAADDAEEYIIYYELDSNNYYYFHSEEGKVDGPENSEPSLDS